jgi:hypothetical protein
LQVIQADYQLPLLGKKHQMKLVKAQDTLINMKNYWYFKNFLIYGFISLLDNFSNKSLIKNTNNFSY